MDEITKDALLASIRHWEAVVRNGKTPIGIFSCALCERFHHLRCKGCPVRQKTRKGGCKDTPYDKYLEFDRYDWKGTDEEFEIKRKELAQAELDFLKSLVE